MAWDMVLDTVRLLRNALLTVVVRSDMFSANSDSGSIQVKTSRR